MAAIIATTRSPSTSQRHKPRSRSFRRLRARLLPWLLGAVSHAIWLLALGAALITLLAMLATRRYDFVWETTILDPRYVEQLALWLGSVPGMLGLPTPDAALIRASDGLATPPADGRAPDRSRHRPRRRWRTSSPRRDRCRARGARWRLLADARSRP